MEDGIERNMSFFITELEKKQRTTIPKYEEQVHPIGLSLISRSETTPISRSEITPISRETTPISVIDTTLISVIDTTQDNTSISHHTTQDNTPIVRKEACREACSNTGSNTGQDTLAKTTSNVPSTNTGSDS
jgi:hypothetical protein